MLGSMHRVGTALRDPRRSVRGLLQRLRAGGIRSVWRALAASGDRARQYERWIARHTATPDALARMQRDAETWSYRPRISILTPVFNTDPRWLQSCLDSVQRQIYPHWQLCLVDDASSSRETQEALARYADDSRIRITHRSERGGISRASNDALALATGELIALLDHDDELPPEALHAVVSRLNEQPPLEVIYTDEDKLDARGQRCDPAFKPDWSPEHLRSCMYICHLMVARTALVKEVGGFRPDVDGAQDYDLMLRLSERTDRIGHIPQVLYHWRKHAGSAADPATDKAWAFAAGERALHAHLTRTGADAKVVPGPKPGLYRVRYRIRHQPLVSIILPTAGRSSTPGDKAPDGPDDRTGTGADLAATCIRSIAEKASYPHYEVVVVHNGPLSGAVRRALGAVPHRCISDDTAGPFNFARTINQGVAQARGTHVLLLNDDVEIIAPDWMTALLEYSQQDPIGAVGAKLRYPDGRLQHIGIILGVRGIAAHALHGHPGEAPGEGNSALIVRNYSAVTAACLMTRRSVFDQVGGFDPQLGSDFNDTDYCLKLRRAGYRVVYTPYAELYHREAATFGPRVWTAAEVDLMRRRWGQACDVDPYYNPNLTRDFPDYSLRMD